MGRINQHIRIGSRDSKLALAQAEIIKQAILRAHPSITAEIIAMKTTGDLILDRNLDQIGGKGLFVKELDQALYAGTIDLSVHSLKDMPADLPVDLPILAYSKREDPRDYLLYKPGHSAIPRTGNIGTSSKRREIQLHALFPECRFTGIRGNVQTRLHKLAEQEYDGTVLALAGLLRLGMDKLSGRILEVTEMLPAAGQGILAVQGRRQDAHEYLTSVNHPVSMAAALAERRFIKVLDGGCSSPVAAYAEVHGEEIRIRGLYYDEASMEYEVEMITGAAACCEQLGEQLALQLKRRFV